MASRKKKDRVLDFLSDSSIMVIDTEQRKNPEENHKVEAQVKAYVTERMRDREFASLVGDDAAIKRLAEAMADHYLYTTAKDKADSPEAAEGKKEHPI